MGCTPSKSAVIYTQDKVCRELDTCSTFVPSLKSSVSTPERPERPRLCEDTRHSRQTFLSVPCRDVHGRSVSQSSEGDCWSSAGSSHCAGQSRSADRRSTAAPDLCDDPEDCGSS